MACKLCKSSITYHNLPFLRGACGSCKKQYEQLRAGFKGVQAETKEKVAHWDNSEAYESWAQGLEENDLDTVPVSSKKEYTEQRCDVRDMKREAGLPKFADLERQVYVAWIDEGVRDEKIQQVLGLTYNQLQHVKRVVRVRLRKQMAYYQAIKKLAKVTKEEQEEWANDN